MAGPRLVSGSIISYMYLYLVLYLYVVSVASFSTDSYTDTDFSTADTTTRITATTTANTANTTANTATTTAYIDTTTFTGQPATTTVIAVSEISTTVNIVSTTRTLQNNGATTTTTSTTSTRFPSTVTTSINPALRSITASRTYGIKAGGTRVTITLEFHGRLTFTTVARSIYFGQYRIPAPLPIEITANSFALEVRSPPSDKVEDVPLTLQEFSGKNWNISQFSYRENPSINGIHPLKHLTSGGTRITIEGKNLDAAEASVIQLNVTVYRNDTGRLTTEVRAPTNSDCFGVNLTANSLICRMPALNLPEDFLEKLERDYKNRSGVEATNTRRRKRSAQEGFVVANFTNDGGDVAVVMMKLITDGYDLSDFENNSSFAFNPQNFQVNTATSVIRIKTGKPKALRVEGNYFSNIQSDNYVISVGAENCTIFYTSDNLILCHPPSKEPPPEESSLLSGTDCAADTRIIIVSNNLEKNQAWRYGCGKYYDGLAILIIAVASVAGGLLLVVFILIGVLLVRSCRRPAQKKIPPKKVIPRAHVTSSVENSLRVPSLDEAYSRNPRNIRDTTELFSGDLDDLNYGTKIQDMAF